VYLVYVKNSCGVPYSTVDASHITITDGYNTKKSYLPVEEYNHETYWIVGCVRYTSSYAYKEIDVFQSEDPAEEDNVMRTYCYDLLKDASRKSNAVVSDEVDVKVTVEDPSTGEKVSGVTVTTSMSKKDYNYTVTTSTDDDGVTYIPVYKNGYYEVTFYLDTGASLLTAMTTGSVLHPTRHLLFLLLRMMEMSELLLSGIRTVQRLIQQSSN